MGANRISMREPARAIPPGEPSRSCAQDDCRRAAVFYAVGDLAAADAAIDLALNMMRVARRLDELRGDPTEVS